MLDCVISGGEVVDGTGAPRRRADVGIRAGRIASVGPIDEPARRTLDARGKLVAPGFVDIHTHYDAQLFWDGTASPSPLHGVTTIVGGNCGFSIAPLGADDGDYLLRMLARVEGMPLESLREGLPWDWTSFGEWLDRLEGRIAVNAGFLVGHSALRRCAMGASAVGEEASESQLEQMVALLGDSLAAGGLGFSSSQAPTHNDGSGDPVPSRFANRAELLRLAGALRDRPGTTLEFIPTVGSFSDDHKDLMSAMSLAANRPLNWNVLAVAAYGRALCENQLSASDYAAARGATVVALTIPQVMSLRLNFLSGFVLDALPGWARVIALPLDERMRALRDPALRETLDKGAQSDAAGPLRAIAAWEHATIHETFAAGNERFAGRRVGEIAQEQGKAPFDALLDLALSDDLRTSFMPHIPGDDDESWRMRAEIWRDPRTVIGASDAGAHLDMIDTFTYSTSLLGIGVRQRGLLDFEEAVHQLCDVPARLYGIRERGRIGPGYFADVVVFDPDRIGPGPVHTRPDLPAGASRLYAEANGIEHVLVNGTEIVRGREFTGATPGSVLRSGRDTATVEVPGGHRS
jgi:N-acyl-D-aspartate/D-glutamate deacylase